jgi:hypothetical protein
MKCGKNVDSAAFYSSKNPKYKYWGSIPICRDCMLDLYNDFYQENPDHRMAVIKFCSAMDIPFADNIFDMAMNRFNKDGMPIVRAYFSFINSAVGKKKGTRFQDSEFFDKFFGSGTNEESLKLANEDLDNRLKTSQREYEDLLDNYKGVLREKETLLKKKDELLTALDKLGDAKNKAEKTADELQSNINDSLDESGKEEEIPEDYAFEWGEGLELKDYEYLEKEIEVWKKTHKCDNKAEETLLKEICLTKLDLRKARSTGDDKRVKDLTKSFQDLIKTAALDPAKANAASSGKMFDSFGVWIKDIEENRPAEWVEDKKLFEDVDNLDSYFKKYIVRPIKNFITGSRDFGVDTDLLSKD